MCHTEFSKGLEDAKYKGHQTQSKPINKIYLKIPKRKPGENKRGLKILAKKNKRWEDEGPAAQLAAIPRTFP